MDSQFVATRLEKMQAGDISLTTLVASIFLIFILFVASGVTGSSLGLGLNHQQDIIESDSALLIGKNRAIRSDEWIVLTPMAIAQTNHTPKFPVINARLGPDGQNMLIPGMTGVPVAHVSSFSKPAVWGYFLFDLRRALSWSWWFPIFGCLMALWWVMSILNAGKPIINLLASVAFVTSSYTVAWSNWPAYVVFFPAISFCLAYNILAKSDSLRVKLVFSILLGLSIPGFLFVLYPAWQVPLAYLFGFIFISIFFRDKLWKEFNLIAAGCLILVASLSGFIIYSWWVDAKPAIDAIQSTIYPGQRSAVSGGGYEPWQFFRGFMNNYSSFYEGSSSTNASEYASFFYFFPVLVVYFFSSIVSKFRISLLEGSLIAFFAVVCVYQFFGFNSTFAEMSLWGRSVPPRTDIALGLASIIFCSLWLSRTDASGVPSPLVASIFGVFYSVVIVLSLSSTPDSVFGEVKGVVFLVGAPLVFLLSFWLLTRQWEKFFAMLVFWNLSIYIFFNPLAVAPSQVVSKFLPANHEGRVLYVGGSHAMWLFAAGIPIYNGIFYYPQNSIWNKFDPDSEQLEVSNRYQHLFFEMDGMVEGDTYQLLSPQADVVKIVVDPVDFDFSFTGATFVLGPVDSEIRSNPSLLLVENLGHRGIFRISE